MSKFNAKSSVSVTELKKDPVGVIKNAKGKSVAITNRNVTKAYLVPAKMFDEILDILVSHELNLKADTAKKHMLSRTKSNLLTKLIQEQLLRDPQ